MVRARRSIEKELYRKLHEGDGKKMIFNMARVVKSTGRLLNMCMQEGGIPKVCRMGKDQEKSRK